MKLTAKVLVPILAVSLSQVARAVAFSSDTGGLWSDPFTWDAAGLSGFPDTYASDSVTINAGHVINYDDIGGGLGPMSTPAGLGLAGGFAIALGNSVTIDGGTLTQTGLTQEMRIGEGTSGGGTGILTIQTGGILNTGASIGLGVGTTINGVSLGDGQMDINDGSLILGAGATTLGFGVGIDLSNGVVNVGDGSGGAGSAIVDLATNNIQMSIGASAGFGGGTGLVTVKSDGVINFGTSNINIGQGGGTGTLTILSGGSLSGGTGQLLVGAAGSTGHLNNSGTVTVAGESFVARGAGAIGDLTLGTGASITVNNILNVGRGGGTGTVTQTGGTFSVQGQARIGAKYGDDAASGGIGLLALSGGSFTSGGETVIGDGTTASGTLNLSGTGILTSGGEFQVGNNGGTGIANITSGTLIAKSYVAIGRNTDQNGGLNGGNGTVNLSGTGTIQKVADNGGTFDIGSWNGGNNGTTNTTGTLNQTGGSVINTVSDTHIGRDTGVVGVWDMSGGTASLASLQVGNSGQGTLIVDGLGTVINASGESRIGNNGGSVGVMTVRNGAEVHFNGGWAAKVGNNGNGTLNVQSGGKVIGTNSWIVLAAETGSQALVNISDTTNAGTLVAAQNGGEGRFLTARLGTAIVNQSGGAVKTSDWFAIGLDPGSNGTYNFTGGTIEVGNGKNVDVANKGTGVLNLFNGNAAGTTITAAGGGVINNFNIGGDTGGNGKLNINFANATDKVVSREFFVGNNGTTIGEVNVTKGILQTNEWIEVGRNGGNGTVNVTGPDSRWESGTLPGGQNKDMQIGYNGGTGTVVVSAGGTFNHNGWVNLGRNGTSNGTLKVNGAGSTFTQTAGRFNIGGGQDGASTGIGLLEATNGGVITQQGGEEMTLGHHATSFGTLNIKSGGNFNATGTSQVFIGRDGGTGTLNVDGLGSVYSHPAAGGDAQVGIGGGAQGFVNVTNGGSFSTNWWVNIGRGGGTGTVNVNGAGSVFTVGTGGDVRLNVGDEENSFGTLNITNGGVVNKTSGGETSVGRNRNAGAGTFSTGTLLLDGTGSLFNQTSGDFFVGTRGNGTMTISNNATLKVDVGVGTLGVAAWGASVGSLTVSSGGTIQGLTNAGDPNWDNRGGARFNVGNEYNGDGAASGVLNFTGGTISVLSGTFGENGAATVNQTGGTINVGQWLEVGQGNHSDDATNVATYNISGGVINAPSIVAGTRRKGTLNVSGTAIVNIGTDGTVDTNQRGFAVGRDFGGGNHGDGVLNQTGGTINAIVGLNIGEAAGAIGLYTMGGGILSITSGGSDISIGRSGTGTFTMTNGSVSTTERIIVAVDAGSVGTATFSGGTATAHYFQLGGGTASFTLSGGTIRPNQNEPDFLRGFTNTGGQSALILAGAGGIIDTDGKNAGVVAGNVISGTSLTKLGNGTLTLAATQSYTTLNANGGLTVLDSALGTGGSTLNANEDVQVNVPQTLAALNIADGAVVTFGPGPGPAPSPSGFATSFGPSSPVSLPVPKGTVSAVAPEPGAVGLLLVGALGLLARRRRAR